MPDIDATLETTSDDALARRIGATDVEEAELYRRCAPRVRLYELLAVRLRGDFGNATTFTMSQRVAGRELTRATGQVAPGSDGEIIHVTPAAWIRQLPAAEVELILTARDGNEDRQVGTYTLVHAGSFHR